MNLNKLFLSLLTLTMFVTFGACQKNATKPAPTQADKAAKDGDGEGTPEGEGLGDGENDETSPSSAAAATSGFHQGALVLGGEFSGALPDSLLKNFNIDELKKWDDRFKSEMESGTVVLVESEYADEKLTVKKGSARVITFSIDDSGALTKKGEAAKAPVLKIGGQDSKVAWNDQKEFVSSQEIVINEPDAMKFVIKLDSGDSDATAGQIPNSIAPVMNLSIDKIVLDMSEGELSPLDISFTTIPEVTGEGKVFCRLLSPKGIAPTTTIAINNVINWDDKKIDFFKNYKGRSFQNQSR